jgi:hypothetical protein
MKFRSCQIQTPLKELQVGSNQGRSGILVAFWGISSSAHVNAKCYDAHGRSINKIKAR